MRVVPLTDSPSAPPADHLFKLQLRERNDIRVIRDLMQRTGEPSAEVLRLDFDRRLMVQFRGSVVQDRKVFQLGKSDYGVMHNGRNRGLDKPEALSEHQARRREWDSIRGYHQGQRPYEPRRKAGHMTAPDVLAQTLIKTLAKRGRPHMTMPHQFISIRRSPTTGGGKRLTIGWSINYAYGNSVG